MSKMQRTKGAAYERELAGILSAELGIVVRRRLGQARDGGHDLTECGKFVIEAKRRARISQYEWYEQVCAAATEPGQIPLVIMRGDGKESLALLSLHDFIPLMRGELGGKANG